MVLQIFFWEPHAHNFFYTMPTRHPIIIGHTPVLHAACSVFLTINQVKQCMVAIYINASDDSKHGNTRKLFFIVVSTNGSSIFIMYHASFSKLNDDSKSKTRHPQFI